MEECLAHNYTTEILSIDPLLIYITNFVTPREATALLAAGDPLFKSSQVTVAGRDTETPDRTSYSATLPITATTSCILSRARSFLGATLPVGDIGHPQLVRYTNGQKFNPHYDWYDIPQVLTASGQKFNRPASFFVFLEANCTGGETFFPKVSVPGVGRWREHEGGTAFKPVEGNALFWVNLMPSGRGDKRVLHAGLPVEEGRKTAMNIWPRAFYD
jgi:prolyl 4-hydroxylase